MPAGTLLLVKGALTLIKGVKFKGLITKIAHLAAHKTALGGVTAGVNTIVVGTTLVGGITMTVGILEASEDFYRAVKNNNKREACVSFYQLMSKSKSGYSTAQDIILEAASLQGVDIKLYEVLKSATKEVISEIKSAKLKKWAKEGKTKKGVKYLEKKKMK
jgi:K+-transporting ATPase c subunit